MLRVTTFCYHACMHKKRERERATRKRESENPGIDPDVVYGGPGIAVEGGVGRLRRHLKHVAHTHTHTHSLTHSPSLVSIHCTRANCVHPCVHILVRGGEGTAYRREGGRGTVRERKGGGGIRPGEGVVDVEAKTVNRAREARASEQD